MTTMTFALTGFDEGGVQRSRDDPNNLRLVCLIEGGGKLVVWGSEGSHGNIDRVMRAGIPCDVECEVIPPEPWGAIRYGHTHWVPQSRKLRVLSK
jgi:hypothetical protein